MTRIYVGNIPFSVDENAIRALFETHGTVESIRMINDRDTGRFRGFGFVDMPDDQAQAAIEQLNGHDMDGRQLRVNEARERERRGPAGGGGGGRY